MPLSFKWGLLVVVLLLAIPLFGHLDHLPIRLWDEARLAKNAAEMADNGNWLVVHFQGEPEMWSTKPPLMIWLQVLCLKLIGYSETAIRLPSALAAAFTVLLLYWFLARQLADSWLGLISALVLLTIPGYVGLHAARTGDYDALLTLFTTAYCLCFFRYLETGSRRMLAGFFGALTLAVLTKGIAGLLFGPALFLFGLSSRQTLRMFRERTFYIGAGAFVLVAVGYYLLREHYNPGYIAAVKQHEWGGRYLEVLEGHEAESWYYWRQIAREDAAYWFLPALGGILAGLYARSRLIRRFTIYVAMLCVSLVLILSQGATKLPWYLVPLYPFLAMLAGLLLWMIFRYLQERSAWSPFRRIHLLPILFLVAVSVWPYSRIIRQVVHPEPDMGAGPDNYHIAEYLRRLLHAKPVTDTLRIAAHQREANVFWHVTAFEQEGHPIKFTGVQDLRPGNEVIAYEDKVKQVIKALYTVQETEQYFNVSRYRIMSVTNSPAP